MRLHSGLLVVLMFSTLSLAAQTPAWQTAPGHVTVPIWPNGAPGTTTAATAPAEVDTTTAKDKLIAGKPLIRLGNVSAPTITLHKPAKANGPTPAVVVFPGGAYSILAIDLEGTEVCDWLNSAGITCVLLKYRVPDSGPYPKSSAALEDAQRAVGLVRQKAAEWRIDPKRVGVLGFSAGGRLAAALSTHFDKRLYDPVDAADQWLLLMTACAGFALVTARGGGSSTPTPTPTTSTVTVTATSGSIRQTATVSVTVN